MADNNSISLGNLQRFVESLNQLFGSDAKIELELTISSPERPEIVDVLEAAMRSCGLPYKIITEIQGHALPVGDSMGPGQAGAPGASVTIDPRPLCKKCRQPFTPRRIDQKNCSDCAKKHPKKHPKKELENSEEKKETSEEEPG